MKVRTALVAGIFGGLILTATGASAQYYGPRPYAPPSAYDDEDDRPPPPRYERWRRPPPGYEDDYGRRGYDRRPQGARVCVTSRGTCGIPPGLPVNAPCRCDIPGFGEKRGTTR